MSTITSFSPSGAGDSITLTGNAAANATIVVFDNAAEVGTSITNASGIWSLTTGTLTAGANSFVGMVVDASGDVSALSAAFNVTISASPSAAAVSTPTLYDYSIINTSEVCLAGAAGANTTIKIFDGQNLLGCTSANAAEFGLTQRLDCRAVTTFSGLRRPIRSVTRAHFPIRLMRTLIPAQLSISIVASGSGITSGSGDVTTGDVVTLTLNMSENVTVVGSIPTLTLSDGGLATYAGGSASSALTFSYTVAAGDNSAGLTATGFYANGGNVEDAAGIEFTGALPNLSGVVQINGAAAAPTPTPTPAVSSVVMSGVGISDGNGDLNAGKTVTLMLNMSESVVVASGAPTLTLNDGGTATYSSGSGTNALTFTYVVTAGQNTPDLAVSSINLNGATITGAAGSAADLSGAMTSPTGVLQIDTTAPNAPTITNDNVNANKTVTLSGTAEANSSVTVYDGSTLLGATVANASGAWSYTSGALATGDHIFTATATDGAGNTSGASAAVDPIIAFTGTQSGTLSVSNGTAVDITGTISNTGTIALNASGNGADLIGVANTTLTGSGKVTLSNNAGNAIESNGSSAVLINANNTISGAGTIGDRNLTLNNQGVIKANATSALIVNTGSNTVTNSGTLESSSTGGCYIESNVNNSKAIGALGTNAEVVIQGSVANSSAGLVLASGTGANVDLENATISGGSLQTSGSNAFIETVSGTTDVLNSVTISSNSTVEINSNSSLTLGGTTVNHGELLVNGGLLNVAGTLSGGGIEIAGTGKANIQQASSESVTFLSGSTGQLDWRRASRADIRISNDAIH